MEWHLCRYLRVQLPSVCLIFLSLCRLSLACDEHYYAAVVQPTPPLTNAALVRDDVCIAVYHGGKLALHRLLFVDHFALRQVRPSVRLICLTNGRCVNQLVVVVRVGCRAPLSPTMARLSWLNVSSPTRAQW